jgi:hypothetical protein
MIHDLKSYPAMKDSGVQDRVGVAEIARDKAYRKLGDRYCFEGSGNSEKWSVVRKKAIDR